MCLIRQLLDEFFAVNHHFWVNQNYRKHTQKYDELKEVMNISITFNTIDSPHPNNQNQTSDARKIKVIRHITQLIIFDQNISRNPAQNHQKSKHNLGSIYPVFDSNRLVIICQIPF